MVFDYIKKNINAIQDIIKTEKRCIDNNELIALNKWIEFDRGNVSTNLFSVMNAKEGDRDWSIKDHHLTNTENNDWMVKNLAYYHKIGLTKNISFGLFMFIIDISRNTVSSTIFAYSIEKYRKSPKRNILKTEPVTLTEFWGVLGKKMPTEKAFTILWFNQKIYKHKRLEEEARIEGNENAMTLRGFYI